ncbi:MAG: hypothetical protein M3Q75_04960, partial [Gemmatimonadota bacterium]|nr:hypothetical protein [Gemmatimonadota bacterium]
MAPLPSGPASCGRHSRVLWGGIIIASAVSAGRQQRHPEGYIPVPIALASPPQGQCELQNAAATASGGAPGKHGGPIREQVARSSRWIQPGPVTLITILYALGYLLWERGDWGAAEVRDLIGNIAFMPLNLGVVALNALASRNPVLDPGVRRALILVAVGAAMVFVGNSISVWYVAGLQQNPPVTWADPFY